MSGASGTESCPHCGLPLASTDQDSVRALTREVEKLRGIARDRAGAEAASARQDRQRIEELTREVRYLRETVARLRGAPAARPLLRS
ncbi:uncharacterized Zn finger protein (UPF0148 family) [Saccharomonospora amisosensis]|uniref:Uncharacterized Zn finger protein (UPF0148 family) n=1 Tax=Saccharomonospora amisosensis TaxID=1128677 RepID=A0A7X5UQL6_9PSEU|nr:hypothetical protein [Saccharomonospora amisosensis]NIJ12330.1 uncharacterized Zn finger protein (UPF0148 family) [Saccharomonospora amisosensis]